MGIFKRIAAVIKPTKEVDNITEDESTFQSDDFVYQSQEKRILHYLQQGFNISAMEALQMFGCFRLSDRIFRLRNKGFNIEMTMVQRGNKKWGEYKLKV